ncbi:MAG: hypothetical protein ACQCXQ_13855 [Verrucomicrobiales bacterium]|nr:hypothetical protein [Verrucomicrobiota bacterium JB025]
MKARFSTISRMLALAAAVITLTPATTTADQMPTGHYTLTGVEVVPIERSIVDGKVNDHKSDTLTHWIRFDVRTRFTRPEGTKTKPFKITNPLDPTKTSLTVDKEIRFKNKLVPAGTNLLKFQQFNGRTMNISMSPLSPLAIQSVRIRDDFFFAPDTYTLTFQWVTKDGKTISDTVKVRIDIQPENPVALLDQHH